jgi:phage terminase large subunit
MRYLRVNKSEKTYQYGGRTVEFIGIDDPQKARGPRRDILYCNEANELSWEDFFQLSIRTRYKIFIDFNPSDEDIWINQELEIKRVAKVGDVEVIVSTYLDNPFLDEITANEIELLAESNPTYWRVYGLGEYGKLVGRIFEIVILEELPDEAKFVAHGQDFGFTNDPSALVSVYKYNQGIVIDERFYEY